MTELSVYLPTEIAITPKDLVEESQIPLLPASKIGSGTFHPDRIPQIPASRISGQFTESSIPEEIARGADVVELLQEHEQASDPHPQYATDSDLIAGLAGKAASAHTHTGLPHVGSSAPSSPAVGDRWLDTGDRLVWFWNGAYWLSEEIFPAPLTSVGSIAFNTAYNLYIRRFTVVALTGATHDASNYWSLNLTRRSSSANTTIATISTQGIAANTPFTSAQQLNLHLDAAALSTLYLRITASTTGSPSGMSETSYLLTYRLVKL